MLSKSWDRGNIKSIPVRYSDRMAEEDSKADRGDRRDTERPHRQFGDALRSARQNLHLERPDVAERAGISYPMLANIESGRRRASDEIVERLAPVLGLRPDRMREVRDALEEDAMRFPTGVGLMSYLSGRQPLLLDRSSSRSIAAPWVSDENRPTSDALVTIQNAEMLALATNPKDVDTATPRMLLTASIIKDLAKLDDLHLARVRGYIDGLRDARNRDVHGGPQVRQHLMAVPDKPFGPLDSWPSPQWPEDGSARSLPNLEQLTRRVREHRRSASSGTRRRFPHLVAGLVRRALEQVDAEDDGVWPPPEELEEAAFVGERLGRDLTSSSQPRMVEPGIWQRLARPIYRREDQRRAKALDWVVRMALVATLLWREDVGARLDFVSLCVQTSRDQLEHLHGE